MADYTTTFVFMFSSLIFYHIYANEFSSTLSNCKNSCERSYPLHTYPKEEPLYACKQGCRLSAIEQVQLQVGGNTIEKNSTETCLTGCKDAFKDNDSNFACVVGCKSLDVISSPELNHEETVPGPWSFHTYMVYVYPVLDVKRYCHGFVDRVGYYYRMSSSYYSFSEGGSILVEVNEQPQEIVVAPQFDDIELESDEPQEISYTDDDGSYADKAVDKGRQWLRCVSQRSGIPFWLLTSMLFMSIFFLLWLCLATATTAPKEKAKVSIVRELMLLDDDSLLEKMPLVKADEKDEAGPLPVKVHIDATVL